MEDTSSLGRKSSTGKALDLDPSAAHAACGAVPLGVFVGYENSTRNKEARRRDEEAEAFAKVVILG